MIIPTALPIFSTIILMNFFRQLPKSLREAALLDGASHFVILFRIYIPVSLASIATLVLFSMVGHWNEWFYPIIYLPDSHMWPLQAYLRKMMIPEAIQKNLTKSDLELLKYLSDKNFKSAQLFVAMIPIICVYPFLQKYFVKGLVIGSVKG
jgi:putative aldouronate transport system permease protein